MWKSVQKSIPFYLIGICVIKSGVWKNPCRFSDMSLLMRGFGMETTLEKWTQMGLNRIPIRGKICHTEDKIRCRNLHWFLQWICSVLFCMEKSAVWTSLKSKARGFHLTGAPLSGLWLACTFWDLPAMLWCVLFGMKVGRIWEIFNSYWHCQVTFHQLRNYCLHMAK